MSALEKEVEGLKKERDDLGNAVASLKAQIVALELAIEQLQQEIKDLWQTK